MGAYGNIQLGFDIPMPTGRGQYTDVQNQLLGLNQYASAARVGPQWARNLLNVIVGRHGGVEKFRLPTALSLAHAATGPYRFKYFSQPNGVRHTVAAYLGGTLAYIDSNNNYGITVFDANVLDQGTWDMVTSNNMLFMANPNRMMKWTGTKFQPWGFNGPTVAPQWAGQTVIPTNIVIDSVVIAGGVATASTHTVHSFQAGMQVVISGYSGNPAILNGVQTITAVPSNAQFKFNLPVPDQTINATGIGGGYAGTLSTDATGRTCTSTGGNDFTIIQLYFNVLPQITIAGVIYTIASVTDSTHLILTGSAGANQVGLNWTYGGSAYVSMYGMTNTLPPNAGGVGGRQWAYAYVNSVTGHESVRSPIGLPNPVDMSNNGQYPYGTAGQLVLTPPTDPQCDTYALYGTLDAGSNFYFERYIPVSGGVNVLDWTNDIQLNRAHEANLINLPPPVGLYVVGYEGRIYIFNLVGNPQGVAYSGYEQIPWGRPEESFPPNNLLELAIGADAIAGGGVIQAGVIAFDRSYRMFLFAGQVEDITTSAPVNFTATLKQLPWNEGMASHYSGQSTPYGFIWLAADRTVKIYNGQAQPDELSAPVTNILRDMTIGTDANVRSAYLNYADRDWYALAIATGGSQSLNKILVFDVNPVASANTGVFVLDLTTVPIVIEDLGVIEDSNGNRVLAASGNGRLWSLKFLAGTIGGMFPAATSTNGVLPAYWESGYYGNETPMVVRMFRRGKIVTDQAGFSVLVSVVDDKKYTLLNPKIVPLKMDATGSFSINVKGKRLSLRVQFPMADMDCSLIETAVVSRPLANRA